MESILLVSDKTNSDRSLCIMPRAMQDKRAGYVLVLETITSPPPGQQQQQPKTTISNINCTARFIPGQSFDPSSFTPLLRAPIYGCLGITQIDNEPFVCVITDCSQVAIIDGSPIYLVNNVMFFSLTIDKYDDVASDGSAFVQARDIPTNYSMTENQQADMYETLKHPCQNLQRFIAGGSFYFSYDFDLTRCAQKRYQSNAGSIWDIADDRFFWNENMIKELLKFRRQLQESERASLDREGILVMSISGFVKTQEFPIQGKLYRCGIISRLSCKRAGTRFNTRGIDDDGCVANNVETEMFMQGEDFIYSNVIVRGSVPLFWEQQGIQLGQHRIQISRSPAATQPAVERHFNDLMHEYGEVHIVNLLSQKEGAEALLTESYSQHVANLKSSLITMTNFDFHAAVKGSQFENVAWLVNRVRDSLISRGFFVYDMKAKKVLRLQNGIFRVNCIDCLDRTNVVEGMLCRTTLNEFAGGRGLSVEQLYAACYNDMWADNGDELSRIYTGTGALKSGFTRTGKRTIAGFMDDAKKSAARFYLNNFQDKSKQEVIDHLLGKLPNQPQIRLFNPIREYVMRDLAARRPEFSSTSNIKVHAATWNVNGKQPLGESLLPWLSFQATQRPELFVIGFQEIVELNAQQIMATDMSKRLVWEELILKSLNAKSTSDYVNLKSGQLVGAALIVIVRADCLAKIRNVQGAIKKTGLAGLAGNKGGIAVRMDYDDTTICFVCAHLAAGHSNFEDRNTDYKTISYGLTFDKGLKIESHDIVIWIGDFNYRIDLDNDQVRDAIKAGNLPALAAHDQLKQQLEAGKTFQGFTEGELKFAPTYKFDVGTNIYDTSEKNRIPAWTDRILYRGQGVSLNKYERAELVSSDHKPVKALLTLEVQTVNKEVREGIQKQLYQKYAGMSVTQVSPATTAAWNKQELQTPKKPVVAVANLIDFDEPTGPPPALPPRPVATSIRSDLDFFASLSNDANIDPFANPVVTQPPQVAMKPKPKVIPAANPFIDNPFTEDPFGDPWAQ